MIALFQEWWHASFVLRWFSVTGALCIIDWVATLCRLFALFISEVRRKNRRATVQ